MMQKRRVLSLYFVISTVSRSDDAVTAHRPKSIVNFVFRGIYYIQYNYLLLPFTTTDTNTTTTTVTTTYYYKRSIRKPYIYIYIIITENNTVFMIH